MTDVRYYSAFVTTLKFIQAENEAKRTSLELHKLTLRSYKMLELQQPTTQCSIVFEPWIIISFSCPSFSAQDELSFIADELIDVLPFYLFSVWPQTSIKVLH